MSILFSVPTNWQDDLISSVNKKNVAELYGKLAKDYVGGGRASATIPHPSKRKASLHIKEAHDNNLKFNYLLNATCLDNSEFTRKGQIRLNALLEWLTAIGVDSVTIAIPYLLEMIKKQYPHFKVYISTHAGIDSVQRARSWEDLGADKLTLSVVDVNRDFRQIEKIRNSVKCQLQVIANLSCLYGCPFYKYHANINSHASQHFHKSRGFFVDYCLISCSYFRIKNPVEFMRAGWIRPEDIHYYENVGIDVIKLVNRGMNTHTIKRIVDAYTDRDYKGNLLDLFPEPSKNIMWEKSNIFNKFMYFFRPFSINLFKLIKMKPIILSKPPFYIDNKALEGFIEYFLKEDCRYKLCDDCKYCDEAANRLIKFDINMHKDISDKYRKNLDSIISGDIFAYLGKKDLK